jgi:hypothetical protein
MGVVERAHRVFVGRLEREVDFAIGTHAHRFGDPERRLAGAALTDGPAEVHLTSETQRAEHRVVELRGVALTRPCRRS